MTRYAALQARLAWASGALTLLAAGMLVAFGLGMWALSVLGGGALSVVNFLLLGRELAASFGPGARPQLKLALGYGARFSLTAAVLAILYLGWDLPLVGLIAGTLSVQAVILGAGMGAAVEETITGRPGRLRALLGFDGAGSPGQD